jgi:hypothetical protein
MLSLTLDLPPRFSTVFIHILISFTFTSCSMQYYWCSIVLFPFSSFPEVHRAVPQLQTCSTSECVYDQLVFVHMFIFGSVLHIWEKAWGLCLPEPGSLHVTWRLPVGTTMWLEGKWMQLGLSQQLLNAQKGHPTSHRSKGRDISLRPQQSQPYPFSPPCDNPHLTEAVTASVSNRGLSPDPTLVNLCPYS